MQDKLYDEIDKAVKDTGKEILNYDDLMELKYLTACIHETLRKYPPVPHIDRACFKDYQLNDDVLIEKGTPVIVNVVAIYYNEEYYPKPEEWRTERMLHMSDNSNPTPTNIINAKVCKRYGLMQIRAAVAQIAHKFEFNPAPGEPYEIDSHPYSLALTPNCGGCVTFIPR